MSFALTNQFISGDAPEIEFENIGSGNKIDSKSIKDNLPAYSIPNTGLPNVIYDSKVKPVGFKQRVSSNIAPESENVLNYNKKEVFNKYFSKGSSSFSFSYITDNYLITDPSNIFDKIFNKTPDPVIDKNIDKSTRAGYLLFSFDRNISKNSNILRWGYDFGFSYSHGNGVFNSGRRSKTDIKFWVIPLDFYLKLNFNLFTTSKISFFAGPSIVGIWQSRSDMDEGEHIKDAYQSRRQIGFGYVAGGNFSISLSRWFPALATEMFKSYEVSNFYLNIEARIQNYGHFPDPINIEGTSIGIGFSVDYI